MAHTASPHARAHPGGQPVSVWRTTERTTARAPYTGHRSPATTSQPEPNARPAAVVPAQREAPEGETRSAMSVAAVPSPAEPPPPAALRAVPPQTPAATSLPRARQNPDIARLLSPSRSPETKNYRIIATPEIYEFTGRLIAFATSEDPTDEDCLRWTEIYIYRTQGGNYVSHVIGRSLIYHDAGTNGCRRGKLTRVHSLLQQERNNDVDESVPCPECTPLTLEELPASANIRVETDRHTVRKAEDVNTLVSNLQQRRQRDGSMYLSTVSQTALAMAAENDPSLGDTRMTVHVK